MYCALIDLKFEFRAFFCKLSRAMLFGLITLLLRSNRPRLREHMEYCMEHPEEISKLSKLKAQITEVKGIMMDNIEKVCLFLIYFFILSKDCK